MRTIVTLCLTTTLLAAPALPAQSPRAREAARAAEQIGAMVEETIDRTMRMVGKQLHDWSWHDDDLQDGGQRVDTTFTFSRDGVLDLTSISGDIVVNGSTRGEAHVKASSERGRLRWRFSSSRITLESESVHGRLGDTRFDITVPEGVRVILRSTSGSLTSHGVKGPVDASTTSGDLEVVDGAGRIELQTLSGDVRASRLRGELEAGTVSGSIDVDDVEGRSVHLESTGGDLTLSNVRSPDVSASTVGGEVVYRGPLAARGEYEFHTHSGDVTLDIPPDASARFAVQTYSGNLDSQFPVTLQPGTNRVRNPRLEFTLGGGDAHVVAQTFSGDITIRRASRR